MGIIFTLIWLENTLNYILFFLFFLFNFFARISDDTDSLNITFFDKVAEKLFYYIHIISKILYGLYFKFNNHLLIQNQLNFN